MSKQRCAPRVVECRRQQRGFLISRLVALNCTTIAMVMFTAQCGGSEQGAPIGTDAATSTVGSASGSSGETGAATGTWTTTGENQNAYVFEGKTFTFEYPLVWQVLQPNSQVRPKPLEAAVVGPGNQTDGVTMYVFKARGFETDEDARDHLARLRKEVRRNGGRLIEGPTAFRSGEDDFTAFYVSFEGRDRIVHQLTLMYLRGRVYRFTCDFLASHGPDIDEGCKHTLETLEIKGLGDVPQ
jgi:hypothetical protein